MQNRDMGEGKREEEKMMQLNQSAKEFKLESRDENIKTMVASRDVTVLMGAYANENIGNRADKRNIRCKKYRYKLIMQRGENTIVGNRGESNAEVKARDKMQGTSGILVKWISIIIMKKEKV
eukprot:TRINITY_DN3186_c0_g1_i1.p3 TRINITY_DN3186_c0_g1~~TRINITY_DN3186_c0_g1_i1.p3  ORF type:complete len:122 (-),score=3.62 TRINITY_DN3186_c0_g1_i1:182-547(-)